MPHRNSPLWTRGSRRNNGGCLGAVGDDRKLAANAEKKPAAIYSRQDPIVDRFRAQHLVLAQRQVLTDDGRTNVVVDETESPLSWLASRRGRDGRALIEAHQLEAGERLRADFTRANLMPRITSDWSNPSSVGRRARSGERADLLTDTIVASRQRVNQTLDAVGPEFAGLLVDVCCFLEPSSVNVPGRHVQVRWCYNLPLIGSPDTTVMLRAHAGRHDRN